MRIALGSTSASKVRATRAVCARAFPEAQIEPVSVSSPVPAQPTSEEETIAGARRRAQRARDLVEADLGVGIEGGVHRDRYGTWVCAWAAVVGRDGREGLGSGIRFPLPAWMAERALRGEELGAIVDAYLDSPESHEALGAIGLLTRGLLDRQSALEQALLAALAPFLSADLYDRPASRNATRGTDP